MTLKTHLFFLILISTLVRLVLAGTIELGNDEVYYITYAEKIQWNYFDHPPLVGILIKLTTLNFLFNSEVFVRLGPIILAALNTWLVFMMGKKISNEKSGYLAALLFTASPYSSVIAGLFIMPDAPMLFFWTLSAWLMLKIIDSETAVKTVNLYLIILGFTIGLAVMGKVHAIFLWGGLGLYILFFNRIMLKNMYLYLAGFITLGIISPIYFWNAQNDFITYKFQGERVTVNSGFNFDSFITELVGGMLYNNPINYILIVVGLVIAFRNRVKFFFPSTNLLFCLSLPMIGILLFISCFRSTLPHWSGPGYMILSLIAASVLSNINFAKYKRVLMFSNLFVVSIATIAALGINYYPGTLGVTEDKKLGEDDLTLELFGWKKFNQDFEKLYQLDLKEGKMKNNSFLICNKWFPGGHLNFYIARPNKLNMVGIGNLKDIHHFYWLNQVRPKIKNGDDAYIIAPSNFNYSLNVQNFYGSMFDSIEPPTIIGQFRGGKKVRNFEIYRARGYKNESR